MGTRQGEREGWGPVLSSRFAASRLLGFSASRLLGFSLEVGVSGWLALPPRLLVPPMLFFSEHLKWDKEGRCTQLDEDAEDMEDVEPCGKLSF